MTDYLKLVQQDNPYAAMVRDDVALQARQAVAGAAGSPPDVEAKLQQLAERAGVPVETVRLQKPEIERRVAVGAIDYTKLVQDNPITAGTLTEHAAIARDDIPTLQQIENTWKAFTSGINKGAAQDELAPLNYKALIGDITPAEQQRRAELKANMQASQAAGEAANTNPLAYFFGATGYTGRQLVTSIREGGKGALGGAAVGAGTAAILGQLGPQVGLPEELVTVPAAASYGARVGYVTASTVYNYKAESGFAFDEFEALRDEQGRPLPLDAVRGAAAAVGLLNAGLETIGDLALAKMVPGLDKLLTGGPRAAIRSLLARPTIRAALAGAGKRWLAAATVEGVTEGVQELVTILGREMAAETAQGTVPHLPAEQIAGRIGESAVEAFVGGGGVSLPGAAIQAGTEIREVKRAQATQQFMQALGEGAEASKLRERMPEAFRDFVAKAKEQGSIENVFIPAEQFVKYFQSVGVDPALVAEQIGAKNYSEAAAAGTDVVIPLEDYATWLAPTEHHAKLMQDVKLHMGDLTMREAEAFEAEREAAQKKLAEEAKAASETEASPVEQIKQELLEDLTNRFELSTAESYATLYAKTIANLAERAGMDPVELHKSYGLRVETQIGELAADGVTLEQGPQSEAFKRWFGDSKAVDAGGKPLVVYHGTNSDIEEFEPGLDDAIWFTDSPGYAEWAIRHGPDFTGRPGTGKQGGNIVPAFLKTDNPLVVDILEEGRRVAEQAGIPEPADSVEAQELLHGGRGWGRFISNLIEDAKNDGHDGIELRHFNDGYGSDTTAYIVFDPEQIKSAIGNRGTFDPDDPSILNQGDNDGKRGFIRFGADRKFTIGLLEKADLSTFLHETGHFWLEVMGDLASRPGSSEQVKADYQALLTWFGVTADEKGPPIVKFRAEAARIEKALPPVADGFARLWRGNRPGETGKATTFTNDLPGIALPFRNSYGGDLSYVDVPAADVGKYEQNVAVANGAEFNLPAELAATAKAVDKSLGQPSIAELRAKITVEHHEQFARANEAYLMEGKAPSAELRTVFQRFRAWLGLIYRHLSNLNVRLNDDVRAVFDRIYATDNEIEAAKRQLDTQPLFATAADAKMTDAEFAAYSKQVERATADAKDRLQAELMREYQRTHEAAWKEREAQMRERVSAEIDALPQYRAFAALTGGDVKLSKDDLVRRYGAEYLKRLPRGKGWVYSKTAGTDADTAAEVLGYKTGDELVQALVNLRPRDELIAAEVKQRMAAEYGDKLIDGSIADDAMRALHNEQRANVIAAELRALRRLQAQARPVLSARDRAEGQQRATALSIPPASVFRDAARGTIGQMQVRDVQPQQYLLAERRASKAAFGAAAKKDYMTAAVEKQRELMNHYLYLEAQRARADMDKVYEYVGKFDRPATRQRIAKAGGEYLEQIDAILERYEFRKVPLKQLDRRKSLAEFAQQMEAQGLLVNVPDELLDEARRVNYRDATADELRAVRDAVKNIAHLAGLKDKLLRKREAVEFEAVKGDLIGSLLANFKSTGELGRPNRVGETVKEKGARLWKWLDAKHLKVEQLVEWMDGGAKNGPWAKYFFDLADDAQTREYDLHAEVTAKLQDLADAMGKEWRNSMADKTDIVLPGLQGPITRYTLMSIALNTGNQSNLDRLKSGFGWTDDQIASVLDKLTEQDWKFVQGVWDTVEHLWPEIVALEQRVTGIAPPKVDAKPIKTRFGDFRGGYFPLVYDPKSSRVGEKQAEQTESVSQFMSNGYGRASTFKGHTKERVAELKGQPLLLDFKQILTSHLGKVIKDISHREAIYSLNKILHDKDIKRALIGSVGEEQYRELNNWMQVLVADRSDTLHQATGFGQLVMKFRTNMAIVTMGWKISTMLSQFAGFGPSADLVKPKFLTQALVDFNRYGPWSTHRETLLAFVHDKSGEMRHRTSTLERDVKDALRRLQGNHSPIAAVRKTAFYLTAMADRQVTVPTWLGAYRQALAEGMSDEDAVRAGDRAVRLSQGAGGAKDLAAVQRNNELMRLLTMFYSPFSVLYARLRDLGHTTRRVQDMPRAVARVLSLVILPAVLGDLLAGRGPDDDEDKTWWAIRKSLLYPIASVPVVRDLSSYLEGAFIGLTGEGEMRLKPAFTLSPVVGAFDKLARVVFTKIPDAIQGERPWDDVAWDTLEASGYVFGLPTAQIRITGEYITDVLTDEANPESPQEALHDLLFRRSKQ